MENLDIFTIYGKAGTGKSSTLAKIISNCINNKQTYKVLASTHSAVDNIYQITKELNKDVDRTNFKTIYSFFRINYIDNILLGCDQLPNYLIFDEFSLINKYAFKNIVRHLIHKTKESNQMIHIIFAGDPLQLNSVYDKNQKISFKKLRTLNKLHPCSINVMEHMHLSIFGSKFLMKHKKKELTKNYRSNDIVIKTLNAIYNKDDSFRYKFIDTSGVLKLLLNDSFVLLASKYIIIQRVYDQLAKRWRDQGKEVTTIEQNISFEIGLKRLYVYPGIKLITTSTQKCSNPAYYNGQEITCTDIITSSNHDTDILVCNSNGVDICISKEQLFDNDVYYFPVLPANMITVHKSQGRSIQNVIVCIDELFDMSMLYTAITRARNGVLFYSTSSNPLETLFKNAYIDEYKEMNELLSKLK